MKPTYYDVFLTYANGREIYLNTYQDLPEAQRISGGWLHVAEITQVRIIVRREG